MNTRRRAMMSDTEWDQVWSDYDARNPAPAPLPTPVPAPLPTRPAFTRDRAPARIGAGLAGRLGRAMAVAALPLLALAWIATPYATAWNLATALEGRDHATLAQHLDPVALQGAVRAALNPAVAEGEQANAFLAAMADDIAAGWASPSALAEVARARGVRPGTTTEGVRRATPVGLTKFEMPLQGAASPMTLQWELKQEGLAPRWQVTGVRLDPAAPAASPGPALRLSAMR